MWLCIKQNEMHAAKSSQVRQQANSVSDSAETAKSCILYRVLFCIHRRKKGNPARFARIIRRKQFMVIDFALCAKDLHA